MTDHPQRDLDFFQTQLYPYEVVRSREGGFLVFHPDLVGCDAQGETIEEAMAKLDQARPLWLRAKWESKEAIPLPPDAEPSGRLMVRVPLFLHARLDRLATTYGKSLNRLNNDLLFNYLHALPAGHGLGKPASVRTTLEADAGSDYPCRIIPDEEGGFVAEHPDLPGCISQGETAAEAMQNLDEARGLWIEARRADGQSVPPPLSHEHSGVMNLRLPPDLHAGLILAAQRNATTLNQLLCAALAEMASQLQETSSRIAAPAAERGIYALA